MGESNTKKILRYLTFFSAIVALFLLGVFFREAQTILVPLVAGVLLFLAFSPVVSLFDRIKVPRLITLVVIFILIAGLFFTVGFVFYSGIESFIGRLGYYEVRFQQVVEFLETQFPVPMDGLRDLNWFDLIRPMAVGAYNQFFAVLVTLLMTFLTLIFVYFEAPMLGLKIRKAFHIRTTSKIMHMVTDIKDQVGHYLSIKFFVSLLTGSLVYLILLFVGMDFPVIWGVLTFFLNFIPNFGSIFAVFFVSGLSVLQFFPNWYLSLLVFLGTGAVQFVVGNLIDPRLQGNRLDISPLLILASLLFWGWLWGVPGMILAVPLLAVIKIIFKNVGQLRPFSILMGTGKAFRETSDKQLDDKVQKPEEDPKESPRAGE